MSQASALARNGVIIVLAAIALALQFLIVPIDADVSWLITVCERVLGGDRLYIDIFEVNPPASVWLYMPQVALAQALAIRPETMIVILTTILAAVSALVTARLCRTDKSSPPPLFAILILGFVTLLLPGGLYAQREHYALFLMLPVTAVMARVAAGKRLSPISLTGAGMAAGLIIVIKPFFLFAVLLPAAFVTLASRAWRPLGVASAGAVAVLAAYALAVCVAAPAYLDAVPMLAEVYGPMRDRIINLLLGSAVLVPAALAALAWVLRPGGFSRFSTVLALALLGFTLAVLIQGKGHWNHALPGMGLGLVLLGWSVFSTDQPATRRRLGASVLALSALGLLYPTLSIQPPPGLVAALRRVAPPNPTIVTLGTELATGHPAVRLVDGRWAGSRASLFTAAGVRYRTANRNRGVTPELERWYREDIDMLARDIARNRPDVILVEAKPLPWLLREPAIATALRDYRPAARAAKISVWVRTPPLRG